MGTTAAQKKLFFNLKRAKANLEILDDKNLSDEDIAKIAKKLNVPVADVATIGPKAPNFTNPRTRLA